MESRKVIVQKVMQSGIRWPHECATCVKQATVSYPLMTGVLIWSDRYQPEAMTADVPYCEDCQAKIMRHEKITKPLNIITWVVIGLMTLIFIPMILTSAGAESVVEGQSLMNRFGLLLLAGIFSALAITGLFLWLPFYIFTEFSPALLRPISAADHEKDGTAIKFPRGEYAVKFNALNKDILWGEWDERSIQAEVEQVKHIEAEDVCWFCGQDMPADGLPIEASLTKEGEEDQSIWIPCCRECNIVHQGTGCGLLGSLAGLMILAGGAGFGYLMNDKLRFWSWVIGVVVTIMLMVILITLTALKKAKKDQKMNERALEYPAIRTLMEQGWKLSAESVDEDHLGAVSIP